MDLFKDLIYLTDYEPYTYFDADVLLGKEIIFLENNSIHTIDEINPDYVYLRNVGYIYYEDLFTFFRFKEGGLIGLKIK